MKLLLYVNDSMNASLIYPSTFYRDILTYKTSPVQRLSFFFPPRIQYCRRWLGGIWKPGCPLGNLQVLDESHLVLARARWRISAGSTRSLRLCGLLIVSELSRNYYFCHIILYSDRSRLSNIAISLYGSLGEIQVWYLSISFTITIPSCPEVLENQDWITFSYYVEQQWIKESKVTVAGPVQIQCVSST